MKLISLGDHLGVSFKVPGNHKGPYQSERGSRVRVGGELKMPLLAVEMEREAVGRGCRCTLEGEKARDSGLSRASGRNVALTTPWFGPRKLTSDFSSSEL